MSRKKEPYRKTFLIFLLVISIGGFIIAFFHFYSSFKNRIWDYAGRINILDKENLTVLSIPNESGNLVEIKLPKDAYVEVADDYGYYKLKDVYEIGQVDKKGTVLLKKTVSDFLGLPIDAEKNELTVWDQYKVWQKKQDSEKSIKQIKLEEMPVFTEDALADGSKIEKVDSTKIDFYLREVFWEKELRSENLSVGVFNASETFGLAEKVSRKIENIGGRVVEAGNYTNAVENCLLKTTIDKEKSTTFKRFIKIFPCKVEIGEIDPRFNIILAISRPI